MKQFGDVTRNREPREGDEDVPPVPVKILDREVVCQFPGSGPLAYVGAVLGAEGNPLYIAGSLINFFASTVDDDVARWVNGLLLNKKSGFDVYDLEEVLEYLITEWSGSRPTKPASGSSRTQGSTGKRSTANSRRVASTRSPSPSTAS